MKKTLRKKFIVFAMSAVTILLVVLVGAISGLSWIILDSQSSVVLHTLAGGGGKFPPVEPPRPMPFAPPNMPGRLPVPRARLKGTNMK